MANRMFLPFQGTNKPGVVSLFVQVTGASDVENGTPQYTINRGAEHLALTNGAIRSAEGVLRLTLRDTYNALLAVSAICDKADTNVELDAEDVDNSAGNGALVDLKFASAGSAADPDSTVIRIRLDLKNSSA